MPLLLLPGTLCDRRLWAHQVAQLQDICVPWVMAVGNCDSTRRQVELILERAPPRFALAGLSYGGILALELMRQAPERVSHLALLDTNARPDPAENHPQRYEQLRIARERGLEYLIRETLLPLYLHPSQLGDPVLRQVIIDMALDCGLEVFANQLEAVMHRADSRRLLSSLDCPTLVLCGEDDKLCPVDRHEEMAAAIPGAELVLLKRCGHMAPLERPESVSSAMRNWLSR